MAIRHSCNTALKIKKEILDFFTVHGHIKSPEAEAERIVFHVFQKTNSTLRTSSDLTLLNPEASESHHLDALRIAAERAQGKPLQHILGNQFFFEHEYAVNPSVLIPRPETETLVRTVINFIQNNQKIDDHSSRKNLPNKIFRFAELGLGSGIISCEILSHFPHIFGVASETSEASIAVAIKNLNQIIRPSWGNRFQIIKTTLAFEAFLEFAPFDLIVSNPPYMATQDPIEDEVLQYEPHHALFPKMNDQTNNQMNDNHSENPNFFYENFILHAPQLLSPNGVAFFEIPHERANLLLNQFITAGFSHSQLIQDLTHRPRVLEVRTKK